MPTRRAATSCLTHAGCSVLSLKGTFSDKDTGCLAAPPSFAGPFAGVNLETCDGNGSLKGSGVSSINGNIAPATFQGTYTVNADWVGTYIVQNSLGLTVHAFFVITDDGNELEIVITDVHHHYLRLPQAIDGRQFGKKPLIHRSGGSLHADEILGSLHLPIPSHRPNGRWILPPAVSFHFIPKVSTRCGRLYG